MSGLFDARERSPLPRDQRFSSFQMLNRFDWPGSKGIRTRLDSWFQRFPVSLARRSLRSRFRSDNDHEHEGALFELLLHELLMRLDCSVVVDPVIADTNATPDFLVKQRHHRFYLEATMVGARSGPFTHNANEQDVIDKLNTLQSVHFGIRVHMEGKLTKTLSKHQVIAPFETLLANYDPDTGSRAIDRYRRRGAADVRLEIDGWYLDAHLIQRPGPRDGRTSTVKPFVLGEMRAKVIDASSPSEKHSERRPRDILDWTLPLSWR